MTESERGAFFSPKLMRLLQMWNSFTGECTGTLSGHLGWVSCLSLLRGGKDASDLKLISGSYDNELKLWDVNAKKLIRGFSGHTGTEPSRENREQREREIEREREGEKARCRERERERERERDCGRVP